MIHNKFRYLLTLVALLAVTTGAWAEDPTVITWNLIGGSGEYNLSTGDYTRDGVKITSTPGGYFILYGDKAGIEGVPTDNRVAVEFTFTNSLGKNFTHIEFTHTDNIYCSGNDGTWNVDGDYNTTSWDGNTPSITFTGGSSYITSIVFTLEGSAETASAVTVDWNKASKTGTFTMPGGNVTLEPEYYPQAALTAQPTAINDVPATTDGAIVKAGTVANIGSTTTAQGTVMYYVSQTALDDDALLALAADQWKADVPTAESLAEGTAYVYYYVRGNDSDNDEENFSDGDILAANALTVTIAAEPTYAVTFAEGTADADKWTIEPTEAKPGTEVKATYSGNRKVIGVKAEKKAATPATPAESTVTWNSENISFLQLYEPSAPFTMMGIKLSTSSMSNTADWRNIGIPTNDGLYFDVTTTGGYTFTAPSGKKFTKIEMTVTNANGWTQALFQNTLGTGWPSGEDAVSVVEDTKKVTWTGTAASTVGLLTDASYFNASPVTSIVFTLADAE